MFNLSDPAGGTSTNKFLSQKRVNNFGTVQWSGRGRLIGGNGTKFRNNGVVTAVSDATFGWDGIGDNPTFVNMPGDANSKPGQFIKKLGQGHDDTVATPATTFDQVALFNAGAQQGDLPAEVLVQQGTLRLNGGGRSYGRFDVPAGTQLQFSSDFFFAKDYSIITGSGHICVLGGTVDINTDVNAQSFSVCDGTLTGENNLNASHAFEWQGGTMSGRGHTNIATTGVLSINGDDPKALLARQLNNAGTANWTGKGQVIGGQGAVINNTGTFNTQPGPGGVTLNHSIGDPPTFNNHGTLNIGANGTTGGASSTVVVRGSIGISGGIFNIFGNYNQAASGILNMNIGGAVLGTTYDQLNINGAARFGGELNVNWQPGFVPQPGAVFEIVHYAQRQGNFNIHIQNLPAGVRVQTAYRDTGNNKALVLQVVPAVAGTFTVSGRVVDSSGAGVAGVTVTRSGAATVGSPASYRHRCQRQLSAAECRAGRVYRHGHPRRCDFRCECPPCHHHGRGCRQSQFHGTV